MSEDITFCFNKECKLKCYRNPRRILRFDIPHSYSFFEGTDECIKTKVEKEEIRYEVRDGNKEPTARPHNRCS